MHHNHIIPRPVCTEIMEPSAGEAGLWVLAKHTHNHNTMIHLIQYLLFSMHITGGYRWMKNRRALVTAAPQSTRAIKKSSLSTTCIARTRQAQAVHHNDMHEYECMYIKIVESLPKNQLRFRAMNGNTGRNRKHHVRDSAQDVRRSSCTYSYKHAQQIYAHTDRLKARMWSLWNSFPFSNASIGSLPKNTPQLPSASHPRLGASWWNIQSVNLCTHPLLIYLHMHVCLFVCMYVHMPKVERFYSILTRKCARACTTLRAVEMLCVITLHDQICFAEEEVCMCKIPHTGTV
jgi:hypothetical protein